MPGTSARVSRWTLTVPCQRRVRGVPVGLCTLGSMTELSIEARGVPKSFGETKALDGVDPAARRGSVLAVLGPNGAGKTTAVRILATLLRPDTGVANVNGFDVRRQPDKVRMSIGLTGQFASVD